MTGSVGTSEQARYLLLALGVGIVGLLVGILLTAVAQLALLAAGVEIGPALRIVTSLVLIQGVAFGGMAFVYLRYRGLPLGYVRVRVPSLRGWIWAGVGYVLALFGAISAALVAFVVLDAPQSQNRTAELAIQEPAILLIMIPASFVLVGPGEEFLFRGIVQGTLREAFGPIGAITLASFIFASVHVVALTGGLVARLVGIAILFFPSLVLGAAYERTGNIVVPALIHGTYNATVFTILYVSIQFGAVP